MEEINAWGAYEAGTTKNARSLGRSTGHHRQQETSHDPAHPLSVRQNQRRSITDDALDLKSDGDLLRLRQRTQISAGIPSRATVSTPSHAVFFGTDDLAALRKTNLSSTEEEDAAAKEVEDALVASKKEDEDGHALTFKQSQEWKELCDFTRDIFHVYFYTDASDAEKARNGQTKKKGLFTKVNGTMPYARAYIKNLQLPEMVEKLILFTGASFRGIAQVYFQNNPLSGLFILAGMFVQSTRVAVHGIIAIVAGNLAGMLMGFDKSFLSCGLFGYNSFLVGLALATFYSPEKHEGYYWPVTIGAIIFAYFSSVLFVMLGKILAPCKTPPFTLPFNIATILFLLAMGGMHNVDMAPVRTPELPSYETESVTKLTARAFFAGSIRGVGQVFLANDIIAGVLVLIGIMICSRISALAAFAGSAVGAGVAACVGCSRDAIENGMYGFNPSLTFTAMLMFYVPSIGSISIGIIASVITVFIQLALATSLEPCGLPFMTLPFCLAALAFIVIQGTTSTVISVPLSSMTTPEDHLNRVSRLSDGFELLHGAIRGKGRQRRRSLFSPLSNASRRLSSVLRYHDETTNGEKEKGLFSRIFECCKASKSDAIDGQGARGQSFRMSTALKTPSHGEIDKDSFTRVFTHIDAAANYEITKAQFREFLKSAGFSDEVGLDFACEAFQLMDLGRSGNIDVFEFIAFGQISRHMPEIRRLVVKFFDFVDLSGDRLVEISELDGARAYLGLPPLEKIDHDGLNTLCNEDGELEFETIVNFVTIFKLKSIIKDYQSQRKAGRSLDDSINSSIHR